MSETEIHPQALVSPEAKLGAGVRVDAFATIGPEVELGDGCVVKSHAVIQGPSKFGAKNFFYPFSTVGGDPQDLTFHGERTELIAGAGNAFRECVTISRGTKKGGGITKIGDNNLFMAYTHIGHDTVVGSHTVFANAATVAGHVLIQDHASIGALSPVHQFCRIGRYAYIGACTVITQDVPPFSRVVTERETKSFGINSVGLERKGFNEERRKTLQRAFRLLLRSKLNTSQAMAEMRKTFADSADVIELIQFIEAAERGIIK
jgi:UDP-N-acetylglucosamine acyltransferase